MKDNRELIDEYSHNLLPDIPEQYREQSREAIRKANLSFDELLYAYERASAQHDNEFREELEPKVLEELKDDKAGKRCAQVYKTGWMGAIIPKVEPVVLQYLDSIEFGNIKQIVDSHYHSQSLSQPLRKEAAQEINNRTIELALKQDNFYNALAELYATGRIRINKPLAKAAKNAIKDKMKKDFK
jgi:hypothetical protein